MDALKFFGELYGCKMPEEGEVEVTEKNKGSEVRQSSEDQLDGARPSATHSPSNLEDLITIMTKNLKEKRRMKACSTGHSKEWCNIIGKEDDLEIIDTKKLNNHIEMDDATILSNPKNTNKFCCFEAGATIEAIQKKIWPESARLNANSTDHVLLNQTGCVQLSIAGTIATAAHGNGLQHPIIADMVRSFRLLTYNRDGKITQYQIEPAAGITDLTKFEENKKFKGIKMLQNDDYFYAALVNIGCMGIVYSYILEVKPAFYLKENRKMLKWVDAKPRLQEIFSKKEFHSFELFVCPYPPIERKDVEPDHQIQVVICELEYHSGPPDGKRPDLYFVQPEWIRKAFTDACEKNAEIVPLMICLMMNATQCKDVVMDACEALDPLSGLAVSGEVEVSECAIKVTKAEDIITVVDGLIEQFQEIRRQNGKQLATSPFAVRFSKESKAYMAMQHDRPSMMIISNILKGTPAADDTLNKFRTYLEKLHDGRPHWGMIHDMDEEKVKTMYGQDAVHKFKTALKKFDPDKIFSNKFTAKVFGH